MLNIKQRIQHKISKYCECNYQQISPDEMDPGKGLFNYQCHSNAVQQVKEGKADAVVMVVHFINMINGRYVDNTLGYQALEADMYLIREINPEEFKYIHAIHRNFRQLLVRLNSNWFEKLCTFDAYEVC